MAYLFSPPYRREVIRMAGLALRCGYPVCWTVYKLDGVWQTNEVPPAETLAESTSPLGTEICNRPQVVPDDVGAELLAALDALNASLPSGVSPATCIPIGA